MKRPLDILHLSLHGLIRGNELELGRDPDTGGQCLYVLELVKALSLHPGVARVTLVTRRVYDRKVSSDYSAAREVLSGCADIRRIEAGPRRYLRKEALWRHLDAFIDGMLTWLRRERRVPDLIHAHYADAGYVGRQVAAVLGLPFVFTGHSLGRVKRERLIEGGLSVEEIEMGYNLHARIEAEELSLDSAAIVCTSTRQEVEEQYSLYHQYAADRMRVIPPGVDLSRFDREADSAALASVGAAMERFLRDHANLVLVGGNRDTIEQLSPGGRKVWLELLRLLDDSDLHGICAIPKKHTAGEVAEIYRWASLAKGVFVNPAFTEPFGLTLLEAAAAGLPVVATNDGGPRDIIGHCQNGELVDPLDTKSIGRAIEGILRDPEKHAEYSKNGVSLVRQHYTWERHVETYLAEVAQVVPDERPPLQGSRVQLARCRRWIVMPLPQGIEEEAAPVIEQWRSLFNDGRVGFGIATRFSYEEALRKLDRLSMPHPAFVISGLGAEIRYGDDGICDPRWEKQVSAEWNPAAVQEVLNGVAGLTLSPEDRQHTLMVSYHRDSKGQPTRTEIQRLLREAGVAAKVLLSYGNLIDVLPIRSGKDVALRYLLYQWGIDPSTVFYYGCFGNDGAVVRGRNLAAIASAADPQLRLIRARPRLFHCTAPGLQGLFEGLEHYRFLEGASPPVPTDPVDDEMPVDELMP